MTKKANIVVIGSGSWGTALAIHLARKPQPVILWGNEPEQIRALQQKRCNSYFLPNILFPDQLMVTDDLKTALNSAENILIAVPSHAFYSVLQQIKNTIGTPKKLAWATKGLDPNSHQLLHSVAEKILGNIPFAAISGPSFAKEVAAGLPTAITLAATNNDYAEELAQCFHSSVLRVYTSDDIVGAEIGSAMKNVLAIAVGIADGLGLGANARAALITRGLAEMMRLGKSLGAKQETLMGLAGVGDLVLTCTDNQSRNRRYGLALGQGKNTEQALKDIGQVVEGIQTTAEIHYLAQQQKVDLPICDQVFEVLYNNLKAQDAVKNLLSREPRGEF